MLTRLHRTPRGEDEGFTLVELLVVMIIIGVLSSIAVPVFLNQRQKAQDTAVKADVTNAGQQITTYYVDNTHKLNATAAGSGTLTLSDTADGGTTTLTVKLSTGTEAPTGGVSAVMVYPSPLPANCTNATAWSIHLTNTGGDKKDWWYSSQGGLSSGTTAPTITCS